MKRYHLEKLRALIRKAAENLSDADALEGVELFPTYERDHDYTIGDRFRYLGKLYRVEQTHHSQADWIPSELPALYTEIAEPGTIPEWKQPTGAQDAYQLGDKVRHNNKVWQSTIDYNVYEPGVYGWEEAT
jgi:hypothetical protein